MSNPAESRVVDDSGVVYYFSVDDQGVADNDDNCREPLAEPGKRRAQALDDCRPGEGRDHGRSPEPPTTAAPPTTTTTAPASPTVPAPPSDDDRSDDDRSDRDEAPKATGSIAKPPPDVAGDPSPSIPTATPDQPTASPVDEPATRPTSAPTAFGGRKPVESTVASNLVVRNRAALDWTFLTGEGVSQPAWVEPGETLQPESDTSSVVLSWLVERDSLGPSMAMLSPVVVLLTIWDAAASAGSGLAAPASGLGTFVLLVLFERGHLGNGTRLLRRRNEP